MQRFMPGARISQAHGTVRPTDPATGARDALALAMYHPAAALRTAAIERESYADAATIPAVLLDARARRADHATHPAEPAVTIEPLAPAPTPSPLSDRADPPFDAIPTDGGADTDQLTLF
jgi:hypothetical protein